MTKEKTIEKQIVQYLKSTGGLVESMQWGKVLVKKAWYNHMMTLNSTGCPDILFYYKKRLYWFEIKKDKKECEKWENIYDRYYWIWKSLDWLKSYKREIWQIQYAEKLEKNWWQFLVTCDLQEVKEFIT